MHLILLVSVLCWFEGFHPEYDYRSHSSINLVEAI